MFPIERDQLEAMKKGKRHDAVVPIPQGALLKPGDTVTFREAKVSSFITLIYVPDGDALTVPLTKVRDEDYEWTDKRVYYIAWDPNEAVRLASREPVIHRPG